MGITIRNMRYNANNPLFSLIYSMIKFVNVVVV